MYIHGLSQVHGPQSISPPHAARPTEPTARPESPQIADEVDISEAARLAEQIRQMPEMREDRIDSVRSQIAEGTYETPDKLSVALDRLLDEIG
jgi:negative regulator of flagellin synthesis FlgM